MSSSLPPSYYFTNIDFNSSYYTLTGTSGNLSLAQANSLYLRKAGDTAGGQENFLSQIIATGGLSLGGNILANSQTITPSQIGYLSNTTSDIQTQINSKQATLTSSTPVVCSTLTTNGAVTLNGANNFTQLSGLTTINILVSSGTGWNGGSNRFGYTNTFAPAGTTLTSGTFYSFNTLTLAIGVWKIELDYTINCITAGILNNLSLGLSNSNLSLNQTGLNAGCLIQKIPNLSMASSQSITYSTSITYQASTSATLYQVGTINFTGGSFSCSPRVSYTKLA